jgi:uncharacterized protein
MLPECPIHGQSEAPPDCSFQPLPDPFFAQSVMKLHLSRSPNTYLITGYASDHIQVNGMRHEASLVVLPDEVITGWANHLSQLSQAHFETLLLRAPEIILLGTGKTLLFPSPALYAGLLKANIGVEVMDTAAACRTYNILAAEGRRVAAALILASGS